MSLTQRPSDFIVSYLSSILEDIGHLSYLARAEDDFVCYSSLAPSSGAPGIRLGKD